MFDLKAFAAEEYRRREAHQLQGIACRQQTRARAEEALRPWAAMALRLAAAEIIKAEWLWGDGTPPCWHHVYPDDLRINDISRMVAAEAAQAAQKAIAAHRQRPTDRALESRAAGLARLAAHFAALANLPPPDVFAPEPTASAPQPEGLAA